MSRSSVPWPFCLVCAVAFVAWSRAVVDVGESGQRPLPTKARDPRGEEVGPAVDDAIDGVRPTCGNVVCGEGGRCPTCNKPVGRR